MARIPELPVTETLNDDASMAVDEIGQPTKSVKIGKMKEIFNAANTHTVDYNSNIEEGEQVILCGFKVSGADLRAKYQDVADDKDVRFTINILVNNDFTGQIGYGTSMITVSGQIYIGVDGLINLTNIGSYFSTNSSFKDRPYYLNYSDAPNYGDTDLEFEIAIDDTYSSSDNAIIDVMYAIEMNSEDSLTILYGDGSLSTLKDTNSEITQLNSSMVGWDATNDKYTTNNKRIDVGDAIDDKNAVNKGLLDLATLPTATTPPTTGNNRKLAGLKLNYADIALKIPSIGDNYTYEAVIELSPTEEWIGTKAKLNIGIEFEKLTNDSIALINRYITFDGNACENLAIRQYQTNYQNSAGGAITSFETIDSIYPVTGSNYNLVDTSLFEYNIYSTFDSGLIAYAKVMFESEDGLINFTPELLPNANVLPMTEQPYYRQINETYSQARARRELNLGHSNATELLLSQDGDKDESAMPKSQIEGLIDDITSNTVPTVDSTESPTGSAADTVRAALQALSTNVNTLNDEIITYLEKDGSNAPEVVTLQDLVADSGSFGDGVNSTGISTFKSNSPSQYFFNLQNSLGNDILKVYNGSTGNFVLDMYDNLGTRLAHLNPAGIDSEYLAPLTLQDLIADAATFKEDVVMQEDLTVSGTINPDGGTTTFGGDGDFGTNDIFMNDFIARNTTNEIRTVLGTTTARFDMKAEGIGAAQHFITSYGTTHPSQAGRFKFSNLYNGGQMWLENNTFNTDCDAIIDGTITVAGDATLEDLVADAATFKEDVVMQEDLAVSGTINPDGGTTVLGGGFYTQNVVDMVRNTNNSPHLRIIGVNAQVNPDIKIYNGFSGVRLKYNSNAEFFTFSSLDGTGGTVDNDIHQFYNNGNTVHIGTITGSELHADNGFTGTGTYTSFTITDGIITSAS